MRGYLTRTGTGMLAGVVLLAAVAATLTHPRGEACRAAVPSRGVIGPFQAEVERCEVRELRDGVCVAAVQVHLWRPGGPVPIEQRIRIDGVGSLGPGWTLRHYDWLVRNEFCHYPEGDTFYDPWLGPVPAPEHSGETRGIMTFTFDPETPGAGCPLSVKDLTLVLPDGDHASLPVGQVVAR